MTTLRTKLIVTVAAALGGLVLYRFSIQFGETLYAIHERHPEMGLDGWLMFGLWGVSAAAVSMFGEHFWKDRKLFIPGDVPMAIMLFYMTVSALIYLIQTGW